MSKNKPAAPAAPKDTPATAPETSGPKIETQFEITDNTEAEATPAREAEASERQLDNGMTVTDYV